MINKRDKLVFKFFFYTLRFRYRYCCVNAYQNLPSAPALIIPLFFMLVTAFINVTLLILIYRKI